MKDQLTLRQRRITGVLSDLFHFPLTIIEAPMGYGKTTAVRNYLKEQGIKPLWVAVADPIESLAAFWDKFAAALMPLAPETSQQLKSLGFPHDAPQTAHILSLFESLDLQEPALLVIDDFHFTEGLPLGEFLKKLVVTEVEHLHIVILTRDTTHLHFPELVAKGLCAIVSSNLLKFSADETREYCKKTYPTIDNTTLENLIGYTDGWISLIYLQLLGLKSGVPVGMNSTINALIDKVLYQVLNEDMKHFLMQLTLLDRFTPKQAAYVTQYNDADIRLKQLRISNAFVQYDETTKTYHIHNVLQEFLLEKRNFDTELWQKLNRRLGEWYLGQGLLQKSYGYFYKAGDVDHILQLLNTPDHIRNELTDFEGSKEMFSRLSKTELYSYPLTFLQHMLLTILTGDEHCAQNCARQIEDFQATFKCDDEQIRTQMLAESMIIKKFTWFNHLENTRQNNTEILELLKGRQSYIMQSDNEFTFGSPHLLYLYFRDRGSFIDLTNLCKTGFELYARYANGSGTGSDYTVEAEYALETGQVDLAMIWAEKAIIKAKSHEQVSILLCADFTLMRILLFKGMYEEANHRLKLLEKAVWQVGNPIFNTSLDMIKGYLAACLGETEKIPEWLRLGEMTTNDFFYQGIAFNYLVHGKALVANKDWLALEVATDELHKQFDIFSNQLGKIHNRIFKTLTYLNLGVNPSFSTCQKLLSKALLEAEPDGIVMPFAEYAEHLLPLLKNFTFEKFDGTCPTKTFVDKVTQVCLQQRQSLAKHTVTPIVLSNREIEVLNWSAQGLNRKGISEQLGVSEGTVKTHFQNIYLKLEVGGKVAAIRKAEMLKLL